MHWQSHDVLSTPNYTHKARRNVDGKKKLLNIKKYNLITLNPKTQMATLKVTQIVVIHSKTQKEKNNIPNCPFCISECLLFDFQR